ncbi:UDP-N-acetylmuramoyl-tripeptide--D-alanyl-D-alanine ligase [Winogradskyella wandonensis]|uniref:UDP-N-acetylmuramoyl-tripeptide--D-alanyl-D-alanine ligase n=1 Tax=Winogradskyella wandonensis TaxID=1442586 RepID=A0A4R1KTN2_9FLAO|nr:UDP-N-acetylmuramoyl-tripeptide--D-alanyl-D-alanine ligase [Winogradskyella wandonensis]TCK68504.1 UDP-N-acetylmuramoyl-tripeptide--D-alanyl-D-alanine ligase [Winogradskyella wandonensis]
MIIEELYKLYKSAKSVCTDTRQLKSGDIYFALKGENFDGNAFAKSALDKGASYCVVDDEGIANSSDKFILVKNSLKTLQKLANYHRNTFSFPIIGLTGSNGKTTTKELIYAVLSSKYKVKATKGNLNNHIGVPLTLLSFDNNLDFGIVEMGANHQKEIAFLSSISEPDYGLITNFGKAHLEGFGGVEGVIKGKSELYDYLIANKKTVFLNSDDEKQIQQIHNYAKISTFGSKKTNDCQVSFQSANPFVQLSYNDVLIKSHLIGKYNFSNIAVAIAIGAFFNIEPNYIKASIESYKPNNNRSEIRRIGTNKFILDAYNANPTSMLAALQNFKQLKADKKYVFLGDMFELGASAKEEHQTIASYAETNFNANVYLIGENFFKTKTEERTYKYESFEDFKSGFEANSLRNATILIKGSRGMALERILELF